MNHSPTLPLTAALVAVMLSPAARSATLDEERDCVMGPHEVVDVSSAVPGLLEEVVVDRSESVAAGQLLARLESRVEQASLELARAWASIDSEIRIEQTSGALDQRRHDRISQLYENRAVALDDRDRAQTEASLASLRLRQAREKRWIRELDAIKAGAALERRAVRSPIDGVVVERFRAAGEYVENQPIVRVARLDPLQIETVLPMALFGQVRTGMVAEVRAENAPQTAHRAVVHVVDRMGDAASGTFGVRLTLPNPDNSIPAGLRCRLRLLPGESAPVPAVPGAEDASETMNTPPPATLPAEPAEQPAGHLMPAAADVTPRAAAPEPASDTGAAPATTGEPVMKVAAAGTPGRCMMLGPLKKGDDARTLAEAMEARGAPTRINQASVEQTFGYIVVSARQPDLKAAYRLTRRLRQLGVMDTQVMPRGSYANRVSVGVYDAETMAEKRRDQVAATGVEVEILARTRTRKQWWVRVMETDGSHGFDQQMAGAVGLQTSTCPDQQGEGPGLLAGAHTLP